MEIKLIDENTDIRSLKMRKLSWDVELNGKPYQVVAIDEYVHTIGGWHGENNLWMYPRNEKPTYENLVEFQCEGVGVCWGLKYEPHNYLRNKWDECECYTSGGVMITRNGKDFYHCGNGMDLARHLINHIQEHPLELNDYGWREKAIGRKVWWRSEPAVITDFIDGQACVILEPEGIERFTIPAEFAGERDDYYEDGTVKTNIFDKHIWWFRD